MPPCLVSRYPMENGESSAEIQGNHRLDAFTRLTNEKSDPTGPYLRICPARSWYVRI